MDEKLFKLIYTFFIGSMLALFVGFGISAFYPAPEDPEYHVTALDTGMRDDLSEKEQLRKEREYEQQWKSYDESLRAYNQNVSIMALLASVVLMMLGTWITRRNSLIANGMVLGGLLTLAYALIRSMYVDDVKYTFAAISVGLLVVLYLGYRQFANSQQPKKKPAKKRVAKKKK